MGIIRVNKHTEMYVVIDKTCLEDMRLSLKARGLAAYLLTKPDDWEINIEHLSKISEKDGKDSVRTALNELEDNGYMHKERSRNKRGHFNGWSRDLYEKPSLNPHCKGNQPKLDFPNSDKPKSDCPTSDNPTQLSNEFELSNDLSTHIHEEEESKKPETVRQAIIEYWNIQPMAVNSNKLLKLIEYTNRLSFDVILLAMRKAKYKDDPFTYLLSSNPDESRKRAKDGDLKKVGMLNRWIYEGVTSVSDVEELDKQHSNTNENKQFESDRVVNNHDTNVEELWEDD